MSLVSIDAIDELESDLQTAMENMPKIKETLEKLQKLLEETYNVLDNAADDCASIADDLRNDYEGIEVEPTKLDKLSEELRELSTRVYDAY